ncbi:hypothetical protein P7C73_g4737, partial [Tremellales sp. Uapishka_1]
MDDTLVPKQEESLMDVSPPLVSSSAKLARKAIRGSDGLWKLVPSPPGPTPSTPTHSQPHANSHAGDVEMRDVSVSTPNGHSYVHIENGGPSSSTPAHGGISLVLKLGGVGAAGGGGGTNGTGMSSRHSSPGLNASGSGNGSTKKKRRIEVPPNPTRASRSAVKPPSPIPTPISLSIEPSPLPTALTQPELPTGPLAIFAPPPPSDFLPDALQDIVGSTLLPPSQAASTSGRIRLTRGRDPGIRSGISASGKGVKVGGVRTTTPVPGKKKGKGKVHEDVPRRRTVRNGLETVDVETRGQRNNGNIVILPDEEAKAQMEYEDMVINSKKYRVPERIIRLDFWEKLGLGKGYAMWRVWNERRRLMKGIAGRLLPPRRPLRHPYVKLFSCSGGMLTLRPQLSIEDVEAANLILGLLHPSVAPSPPDPEAELRTPSHQASTPSTPETATRKIMLRMTRPSGLAHSPTTANMAPPETPLSGVFKEDLVETD